MLGEKVACATVSLRLCMHTVIHDINAVLPATLATALQLRGFQKWLFSCHKGYYG